MGIKRTVKNGAQKALDRDRILGLAARYEAARIAEKEALADKKELGEELRAAAVAYGAEDGLSHVLVLGNYSIAQRASISDVIDQEAALQFLESKDLVEECTTRSISKDGLSQCLQSGEITPEDLETFMSEKVSYKIELKVKSSK